jgi:hypothetical protein
MRRQEERAAVLGGDAGFEDDDDADPGLLSALAARAASQAERAAATPGSAAGSQRGSQQTSQQVDALGQSVRRPLLATSENAAVGLLAAVSSSAFLLKLCSQTVLHARRL